MVQERFWQQGQLGRSALSRTVDNAQESINLSTSVRDLVTRYPGIEDIFEEHGLMGCGGPNGPLEPIGFFARVHRVDPQALLAEIKAYVRRQDPVVPTSLAPSAPRRRDAYPLPLATSFTLALLAGFALGILVALALAFGSTLGGRWAPLVQAHGHVQVVGWVGLFIIGIAYHVVPRFKGVPLRFPGLAIPAFALVASGILLRLVSQPYADDSWGATLMVFSGVLELAGILAFAINIAATLQTAPRRETYDPFLLVGSFWFVAQAAANLFLLVDTARAGIPVIPWAKDEPLLYMQFYGFITTFVFGVSLRVVSAFLSLPPTRWNVFSTLLWLLTAGVALHAAVGWVGAYSGQEVPSALNYSATYLVAAAALSFPLLLNVFSPSQPIETGDTWQGYAKLIRLAYGWLMVAAALEVFYTTRQLAGGDPANWLEAGAIRHILALGFITQMIFGVGSRALPVFSGKKLYSLALVDASFILINAAVLLRVAPILFSTGTWDQRYGIIGISGFLGLLAVAAFGYNIIRTIRGPQALVVKPASPSSKGAAMTQQPEKSAITPDMIVADVLERLPGSLEVFIRHGFTPLADPNLRQAMAPLITIERASQIHPANLDALLADLNRLAENAG